MSTAIEAVYEKGLLRPLQRPEPTDSDSIAEIEKYWGDASIDDIHARIMQWKKGA